MRNGGKKAENRPFTIILVIILTMLSVYFFAVYIAYPRYMHNRLIRLEYNVYGGLTDELKKSELFKDMESGKSFCFVGDSITKGNEIYGIHWYEPLIPYIRGNISDFSHGGWTVSDLVKRKSRLPSSDIYVVAIGINDVMHPDSVRSAATAEDYVQSIRQLTESIVSVSTNAKIYFIAPWALPGWDEGTIERGRQFRSALKDCCGAYKNIYIDPEPAIMSVLNDKGSSVFMKDGCHPNAAAGVGLYSYAVLSADYKRTNCVNFA